MKMCSAFRTQGHSVSLLAPNRPPFEEGVENVYDFYGVKESFDLRVLPWRRIAGRSYIYAVEAASEASRRGVRLVYSRFLRGAAASTWFGLPTVLELHAPPADGGRVSDLLFRRIVRSRHLKRVVAISQSLSDFVLDLHPSLRDRMLVAHDAADTIDYTGIAPAKLRGSAADLQVGYVGHLYEGKGMELIAEIASRSATMNFHIVGGTSEDIDRWTAQLRGVDNVHFYGHVPHGQTPSYLAAFDVLLAPYQRRVTVLGNGDISRWMSPLKIFEYMAAGKPIVCSDLPVLREVLQTGETAMLCNPDNAAEWISALEQLARDAELRLRLADGARNALVDRYSWTERGRRVLEGLH